MSHPHNALQAVAARLQVDSTQLKDIIIKTVMPNGGNGVTEEQFLSFISVANEYGLNPLIKEIYAFPAKGGGIQPIVSIDGWLRTITSHPDFDGMEHVDMRENGQLIAIECKIYRKSTSRPVTVTEYMEECRRGTDTWKQWPSRMLRHKATIQAGRYAFGISGIIDPDEAERFKDTGAIIDATPTKHPEPTPKPIYSDSDFTKNLPSWTDLIESGKKTADQIIKTLESRAILTDTQKNQLLDLEIAAVERQESEAA